jgi:hypothetical protein
LDLDSTPAPKKKNSGIALRPSDFKSLFSSSFNAFFSACLHSSAVLADSTCRSRVKRAGGSRTMGSEDIASSVMDAAGLELDMDMDDNTQDVLEAILSSLCTIVDYATPSLKGERQRKGKREATRVSS